MAFCRLHEDPRLENRNDEQTSVRLASHLLKLSPATVGKSALEMQSWVTTTGNALDSGRETTFWDTRKIYQVERVHSSGQMVRWTYGKRLICLLRLMETSCARFWWNQILNRDEAGVLRHQTDLGSVLVKRHLRRKTSLNSPSKHR